MIGFFPGVIWDPTGPYTTALANLTDQLTLNLGAIPFASGEYLLHVELQIGWNPGANGANTRNGAFVLYDGTNARQAFKWGRMKTGSTGHGYGTAQSYSFWLTTLLTQGNDLKIVASTEAYLLGGQVSAFSIPPYKNAAGTLS